MYALFIKPFYNIEKLTTLLITKTSKGFNKSMKITIGKKLKHIAKWLENSRLKVNKRKTALYIFLSK
jgi:hypothetical protein